MSDLFIVGLDLSFTGAGISDGQRHEVVKTDANSHIDDRIDEITDAIYRFTIGFEREYAAARNRQMWCVEAPMLAVGPAGGGHLFEIGNLMRAVRYELVNDVRAEKVELTYLEVGIGALRHFSVGCGNAPKKDLAYMVERIHGVTFDRDPGQDKLVAWSLVQYGRAIAAGDVAHAFAAPRGKGRDSRANARKAQRTRRAGVQLAGGT